MDLPVVIRERNAESHAWPGGYPIGYTTDDGEVLCADCVNNPTNPVHTDGIYDGWCVIGYQVLEGSSEDYNGPVNCGNCYKELVPLEDDLS